MSEIFTLKETLQELRLSRAWMMQKIREKKVNVVRMGSKIYFNSDEIERIKKEGVAK